MKSARHQAILDLIEKHPIDRQEDLLSYLRETGFDVTRCRGPVPLYACGGLRQGGPFAQPV